MKYYIPELNLRDIRNNINLIENLSTKFTIQEYTENIVLSVDGYYKCLEDSVIKYKIIEKDSKIIKNFIDNYSLIGIDTYDKKIGEIFNIPSEHSMVIIKTLKFSIENGKNFLIIKKNNNNKIIDIYFESDKKLHDNDIFFKNDVSLFIKMLICK